MKKVIFLVFIFVVFGLLAEETNWISYDGWVTGSGAEDNKYTYLLPFGLTNIYTDDHPLLYETDMGWPVPDEDETELKYLFFGDTKFFMRDQCKRNMSKITDGTDELLNFDVADDYNSNSIFCNNGSNIAEIEKTYNFQASRGKYLNIFCLHNCKAHYPTLTVEQCQYQFCDNVNFLPKYSDCFSACKNLSDNDLVFDYMNIDSENKEEKCEHFCKFDMLETYVSAGYFLYDFNNIPIINGQIYNNGTSNIFLAAELDDSTGIGNETQYKVKFRDIQNASETGLNSPQVYSTTNKRRSKSIWMNPFYERNLGGMIGIYPRGYFYASSGNSNDTGQPKKLFVPYEVSGWNSLNPRVFCETAIKYENLNIGDTVTFSGDILTNEMKRQIESLGVGIYDFEDECRVKFSNVSGESFPTCDIPNLPADRGCFRKKAEENYPNKYVLWPTTSKMSNLTVIHGINRDILSIDDNVNYIYFMGTGKTEVYTDRFDIRCWKEYDPYGQLAYYGEIILHQGYLKKDLKKTIQKAYITRVPAYENDIKCAASYEYFKGITNGIARWSKNIEDAVPLYGFYPLQAMGAESIVKHRDLYWITAPLNETTDSELGEDKKGVVVLASPDALHWQKVDTILFENPDSIWVDYAFFWLPTNLIKSDDNTMPFLYSVWKANEDDNFRKFLSEYDALEYPDIKVTLKGFLDDDLNPKFTHYNLKMGKYKFMEKAATRAFLVNDTSYGIHLNNTISGDTPNGLFFNIDLIQNLFYYNDGTIALPFRSFQNLNNLIHTDSVYDLNFLKNRYAIIEYCYCDDQTEDLCLSDNGNCSTYKDFIETGETNNDVGNWKIIDMFEDDFFNQYVLPCKNGNENVPDYMCNIPFEHNATNLQQGHKNVPVWNWRAQISKDLGLGDESQIESAKVILRFSHWNDQTSAGDLAFEQGNYTEINRQLLENIKLIPYDCNGTGSSEIIATCKDSGSWRTTRQFLLKYKKPFDIDDWIKFYILPSIRIEYLYPYPVMIHDFGKPGDPAPWVWDMLVADHFAKEFFKVSSFVYGDSVTDNLMSGAAATAVIKNGTMQIYAWGGSEPDFVPGRSTYGLERYLYIGTFNPVTEVVTFEQTTLVEREGNNSPDFTAGASMVYDDEKDEIYLIGAVDKNGTTKIYRLKEDIMRSGLKYWETVTTIELGRYFRLVKKSEREYFAFGGKTGETSFNRKVFLINLDDISHPKPLPDIPVSGLANSFAAYNEKNGKLYIYGGLDSNGASDRFLSLDARTPNANWVTINAAGSPGAGYGGVILVDYITDTISLGGGVFVNSEDSRFKWTFDDATGTWTKELKSGLYCMKEADSTLQGGLEMGGDCVPFTHPWYKSLSAGTTVYSIAGKGNWLYVGTNDSIKIYDISDANTFTLVSTFQTNNARVYDMEIEGDTLFAATSKGLYKLDAGDPDELTQTLFVATSSNNQYEIELYDGKVYVGDDYGIKIRDKETLSVLSSANSGAVYDFAIQNGEIAMFRSSFLNSGIQFRDAETLVETAYDYTSCSNAEIETYNGKFYLACDNYTYSFEANNGYIYFTQLSGDKRELQEVYTYNGYTYIPDGNTIKLSTHEDVPALCGNGIVEGDEVCDGGQIDCDELDSSYVSGIAACNSTCDGYVLDNCTAGNGGDGW